MSRIAVRVVIAGRAQGVGYRYRAVAEAERHGVDGWAQNRGDGAVEAVRAMITACREGPRFAAVAEISEFPADAPDAPGFRQMR
jgi:acylphosphatase